MSVTGATSQAAPAGATITQATSTPVVEVQIKKEPAKNVTTTVCEEGKHSTACIKFLIGKYAKKYGVDKTLALDIARCESSFRANVYGDGGRAFGTFQFHRPTFDAFSDEMGAVLDYYNNEDNIKLAMWAFANGKEDHWSCYDKVAFN